MTQEDKQLLIKDLCARIPYTPLVLLNGKEHCLLTGIDGEKVYLNTDSEPFDLSESSIKPYLRPMSSMTEEELFNYKHLDLLDYSNDGFEMPNFHDVDWLNKHHFDYRRLIEKGLALKASERMYKTE